MDKSYRYYPGCSLKGLGKAYEESFLAVFRSLGAQVEELPDWNCCGATAYMSIDESDAALLAARNLSIAEREDKDLLTPCAGCYLVLNKSKRYIEKYPAIGEKVKRTLSKGEYSYEGKANVRHPLEVLLTDVGLDAIRARIVKPLKHLNVACYYGCQLVRPYAVFDSQTHPMAMDHLMTATGAKVMDYPLKTKCCGGSLTGTISEAGLRLCYILLKEFKKRGADVVATACPLCQFNLEAYQDQIARKYEDVTMPVLYFTQVLGLALGLSPRELGLRRQIVPVDPILKQKDLQAAAQPGAAA